MYVTYLNDENVQRVKLLMTLWSMTIYSDTVHRSESTLAHDRVSKANVSDVDIITEFREIQWNIYKGCVMPPWALTPPDTWFRSAPFEIYICVLL